MSASRVWSRASTSSARRSPPPIEREHERDRRTGEEQPQPARAPLGVALLGLGAVTARVEEIALQRVERRRPAARPFECGDESRTAVELGRDHDRADPTRARCR